MKIFSLLSPLKILILHVILISNFMSADVRYVSKTGTSQFPYTSWETASDSIQKCLDICDNGDSVYVGNGIYKENLLIKKTLALIGSSMDSTIVDGTGMGNYTIEFDTTGSIENFCVYGKGQNTTMTSVIWANSSNIQVKNCRISGAFDGVGTSSSNLNSLIITNVSVGFQCGCYTDTCNNYIKNSLLVFNNTYSYGIRAEIGGNLFIQNNLIIYIGTKPNEGISLGYPNRVIILNNLISGFLENIYVDIIADTVFIFNNIISNKMASGIGIRDGSIYTENDNAVVKNNILINNKESAIRGFAPYITSDYNIFWNNQNDLYVFNYGDSDRVVDPMFVKDTVPSLQSEYDFHLQAFSPGIHKGDPSILNKDGTRSDIGMYGGPLGETYTYKDLAPRPPVNLSAVVDSNRITLKWNKNTEADTAYYMVYRDTAANFIIDSTKLVSKQKDTALVQTLPLNSKHLYYKVTAIDKQGNISQPSEELTINITSISGSPQIINNYKLFQNYPNPFNPSTIISYRLKDKGYVKLMLYDIKGELVKVLVNETKEAGFYEFEFNAKGLASGIYLYRIEVIGKGNIPVFSDMKKTILLK